MPVKNGWSVSRFVAVELGVERMLKRRFWGVVEWKRRGRYHEEEHRWMSWVDIMPWMAMAAFGG